MLDWGFNADSSDILLSKEEWETLCKKKRNSDILDAMVCFAREGQSIPDDWLDELAQNIRLLGVIDNEFVGFVGGMIRQISQDSQAKKSSSVDQIKLLESELEKNGWAIAG